MAAVVNEDRVAFLRLRADILKRADDVGFGGVVVYQRPYLGGLEAVLRQQQLLKHLDVGVRALQIQSRAVDVVADADEQRPLIGRLRRRRQQCHRAGGQQDSAHDHMWLEV